MNFSNPNLAETKSLLLGMVAEAADLKRAAGGSITDAVADWLAPQYMLAAREKLSGTEGATRWDILRMFVQDWTMLRRGEHSAARLQLDREELDWQRANSQSQKEKEFQEWLKRPEIRAKYFPERTGGIRPKTLKKIERELKLL
ncbi:MAG: hypothetical protein WBN75_08820 [Verrucomicrobiia bacterium]